MKTSREYLAIDANVILRYLLGDNDELFFKAKDIFMAIDTGSLAVELDPVILAEVVFVMQRVYKQSPADIAAVVIPLIQHEQIVVPEKERYLRALHLYANGLSHFGDACACAAAIERCEGQLLSFDRGFGKTPDIVRRESLSE